VQAKVFGTPGELIGYLGGWCRHSFSPCDFSETTKCQKSKIGMQVRFYVRMMPITCCPY